MTSRFVLRARRCTATNRAGEQCGRAPIPGGNVCALHGGKAPQTIAAAKARLLAGADLAIDYLLALLEPRPPCPVCGRSDGDRDPVVVRACQLVLDRAGYGPSASLTMTTPPDNRYDDLSAEEMVARCEKLLEAAREYRDSQQADVIDAATTDVALLEDGASIDAEKGK